MSFESGDYLIYTEEKVERVLNNLKNNTSVNGVFESKILKIFKSIKNNIYIFEEYTTVSEDRFSALINGKVKEYKTIDFRLATKEEKKRYDLSRLYKG
jgi:hypothetical protein